MDLVNRKVVLMHIHRGKGLHKNQGNLVYLTYDYSIQNRAYINDLGHGN